MLEHVPLSETTRIRATPRDTKVNQKDTGSRAAAFDVKLGGQGSYPGVRV